MVMTATAACNSVTAQNLWTHY